MSILGLAAELEKKLMKTVRRFIGGGSEPHHLEIRQAILDEIESRVQPIGDGVSVFPYNRVLATIYAPDEERRYFFESAFIEDRRLKDDIRDRLSRTGCRLPQNIDIEVKLANTADSELEENGFRLEFRKQSAYEQKPAGRLVVLSGQVAQQSYVLTKSHFNIGRMDEVKDKRQHIVRRNDMAFAEGPDEISQSISRAHAHVWYDEKEGAFRLCDDNSAQGTHIFRDGRNIEVPRNSPRGIRLHGGDEIYFGKAYVRFEIDPPEAEGQSAAPGEIVAAATPAPESDSGAMTTEPATAELSDSEPPARQN